MIENMLVYVVATLTVFNSLYHAFKNNGIKRTGSHGFWYWFLHLFLPKPKDDGNPRDGGSINLYPGKGINGGRDGKIYLSDANERVVVEISSNQVVFAPDSKTPISWSLGEPLGGSFSIPTGESEEN